MNIKSIAFVFLFWGIAKVGLAQFPKVTCGTLNRWPNLTTKFTKPRNVDVWLPPNYDESKRYPVLYMFDGQMLFDSTTTWNKQEWGIDDVMGELLAQHQIEPCIVVGVWNIGTERKTEYFPEKPYFFIDSSKRALLKNEPKQKGFPTKKPWSDSLLLFIVKELKPFIDKNYCTRSGRKSTFIGGSSRGGLMSWYALCEYPKVFGGAICMSTHWTGIYRLENNPIPASFFQYLEAKLPKPGRHKIYFDYGTTTLDSLYEPFQLEADKLLKQKKYSEKNWMTLKFEGENHTERAWRRRLHIPLKMMLGPRQQQSKGA